MQAIQPNHQNIAQYLAVIDHLRKAPLSSSDKLAKDLNPPSPTAMGLKPIEQYNYLTVRGISAIGSDSYSSVKENINNLKNSDAPCYFIDDRNPLVAQLQSDGQFIWKAVDVVNGGHSKDVGNLLTSHGQSVHVNTGTHGDVNGIIPADGDFVLATRLGYPAFFNQDTVSFTSVPNKTSFLQISSSVRPDYPEKANHVIDAWCFSSKTLFTTFRNYNIPKDMKGQDIPVLFKCVVSNTMMKNPMYSTECNLVGGKRHYYDKSIVKSLVEQNAERIDGLGVPKIIHAPIKSMDDLFRWESSRISRDLEEIDPNKIIKCRLDACNANIHLQSFKLDVSLREDISIYRLQNKELNQIKGTFQQVVNEKNQGMQQIATLRTENQTQSQQITTLESEKQQQNQSIINLQNSNQQKDQTIVSLNGRVTDLTTENEDLNQALEIEKNAKELATDRLKQTEEDLDFIHQNPNSLESVVLNQSQELKLLNQEMEKLKMEPSIKEFIKSNPLSKRYTPEEWEKKLMAQKQEAEYWLSGILQGRLFERVNAFISQGVRDNHNEKQREIIETLLAEIKQRVIALVRNSMHYYSTDLIDTFIIGEFQVRYNDAEFKEFLQPLMEKSHYRRSPYPEAY